jgi:hypothetical protein
VRPTRKFSQLCMSDGEPKHMHIGSLDLGKTKLKIITRTQFTLYCWLSRFITQALSSPSPFSFEITCSPRIFARCFLLSKAMCLFRYHEKPQPKAYKRKREECCKYYSPSFSNVNPNMTNPTIAWMTMMTTPTACLDSG